MTPTTTTLDLDALQKLEQALMFPAPWQPGIYHSDIWCPSEKGGDTKIIDIRGWGYLTGKGSGALGLTEDEAISRQKALCEFIVAFRNNASALIAKCGELQTENERLRMKTDEMEEDITDLKRQKTPFVDKSQYMELHKLKKQLAAAQAENERLRAELSVSKGETEVFRQSEITLANELAAAQERIRELETALSAMRDAVKEHPDFQCRQYVDLGIQVNNALATKEQP